MTHCENMLRTIRFEYPEHIPVRFHVCNSVSTAYDSHAVRKLPVSHHCRKTPDAPESCGRFSKIHEYRFPALPVLNQEGKRAMDALEKYMFYRA